MSGNAPEVEVDGAERRGGEWVVPTGGKSKAVSLTIKERAFVDSFKKWFPDYKADAPTLKKVCEELGLKYKTASTYLYARPRITTELRDWKERFRDGYVTSEYTVTAEWVMGKLTKIFDSLEREESKDRTKDMTDVLESITNLLVKFRGKFDSDLKRIKEMSMPELLATFSEVAGKVFGNERAGELFKRLVVREGQSATLVKTVDAEHREAVQQEVRSEPVVSGVRLLSESEETHEAEEQGRTD